MWVRPSEAGSFEGPFGKQRTRTSKDKDPELRHSQRLAVSGWPVQGGGARIEAEVNVAFVTRSNLCVSLNV